MAYRFFNANAVGRFSNDCTVRALSCATGKSWDEVYEKMSALAQYQGTMMDDRDFIRGYLDLKYERVPYMEASVGKVAEEYCDYIMLITMEGHITCAKYGIIYDSFDCRSRKAENAWIVK